MNTPRIYRKLTKLFIVTLYFLQQKIRLILVRHQCFDRLHYFYIFIFIIYLSICSFSVNSIFIFLEIRLVTLTKPSCRNYNMPKHKICSEIDAYARIHIGHVEKMLLLSASLLIFFH